MNIRLNRNTINSFFNDYSILSFVEKNIPKLKGKILDVGCGRMKYKNLILSSDAVSKYIGLDLEEGKFSYSVKADLYWDGIKMPIKDNSIDGILLLEVLEHCPDPRIVVAETFRVLKKGGIILVSTPFIYQIHGSPFDYNRLTPYGIESLLSSAGFRDMKIESSGGWDASLGQMIGIWITHRPMLKIIRKFLSWVFAPIFKILLWRDRKNRYDLCYDNLIMSGVFATAFKQ